MSPPRLLRDSRLAWLIFALLLTLYVITLCPTVGVGDSGELTTAVAVLGIPHPTGYPLYILLGKLFIMLVPIGDAAVRMNLFSAVCAAGAPAVLFLWLRRLQVRAGAAFSAALMLGLSLSYWGEATIARVYSLNALLVCLCLFHGVRPERSFRTRAWFFLWWGLALANHTVSAIVGLLVLATELPGLKGMLRPVAAGPGEDAGPEGVVPPPWKRAIRQAGAALFMIPGLALYLYIPLRARMQPALNFGDPRDWDSFWTFVLRTRYWKNRYLQEPLDLIPITGHYLSTIPAEFTWLGVALVPAGLAHMMLRKEYRLLGVAPGLFFMNALLVGLHGSPQDIFHWSRYMIVGYIGVAVIIAFGMDFLGTITSPVARADAIRMTGGGRPGPQRLSTPAIRAVARTAPVLLPAILLATNFVPNNRSGDYLAYHYNYRILAALPPGAILMPTGDNNVFPLMYLQKVAGIRPDVRIIASYYNRREAVPLVLGAGLFYTNPVFDYPDSTYPRIEGLIFRLLDSKDAPRITRGWQGWRIEEMNNLNLSRRDMLTRLLASQYWHFAGLAIPEGRDICFQRSLDISHDYDRIWELIGRTYSLYGQYDKAEPIARRALEINPRNRDAALLLTSIRQALKSDTTTSRAGGG